MSEVLTVRIEPNLLSRAEARAARLGLDRAGYVRNLIQRDLEEEDASTESWFASEDLVGTFRLGGVSASNTRVRDSLRRRSGARNEPISHTGVIVALLASDDPHPAWAAEAFRRYAIR